MFRPLRIQSFGTHGDHAEIGMVVMEDPQGSIYRYDWIIPKCCEPKTRDLILSIAISAVMNDAENGISRYKEGEDSPLINRS